MFFFDHFFPLKKLDLRKNFPQQRPTPTIPQDTELFWKNPTIVLHHTNRQPTLYIISSHKHLNKTVVKIFMSYGPLRLHHETGARSSQKDLPENCQTVIRFLYQTRIKENQLKAISRHNESDPTHTSAERFARAMAKFAPRHSESDPTCT